ncbi:MAG: hypothetical protein V4502_11835 [Pseudomonadota bacterium]
MDLTLISIVTGLGLSELLLTFYRLVRDRRNVTWDPLSLVWSLLILIAVVNFWWGIRAIMAGASDWTTGDFMLSMISPIFLFLACAAALPSTKAAERTDMRALYADQRTAFLIFFLGYQAGNWLLDASGLTAGLPLIVLVHRTAVCLALIIALVGRSRRWDWFGVAIVALAYGLRLFTQLAH